MHGREGRRGDPLRRGERVVGPVGGRLADLPLVEAAPPDRLDDPAVLQVHHLPQRLLVHPVPGDEVLVGALLGQQDLAAHVDEGLHDGVRDAAVLRLHVVHAVRVLHVGIEPGDHVTANSSGNAP